MTETARKAAVVTGGGSGIGRALAKALAEEGASVVVADILQESAQSVASEISSAGGSALAVVCDVSDRASVRTLKAKANAAFGAISLLFANAGATSVERLTDLSDDDFDWITHVNLLSVAVEALERAVLHARDYHVAALADEVHGEIHPRRR